jgi:hypothetical protein
LAATIETYCLYAFIATKYLARHDVFKLSYVRDVMFQNHTHVLFAKHRRAMQGWWAVDAKTLPADDQRTLKAYHGSLLEADGAAELFSDWVVHFLTDAEAACQACGVAGPKAVTAALMQHIRATVPAAAKRWA